MPRQRRVVEIASGDPRFTSLVAALTKAELVDDLSGAGPFTVFAPTNEAFAAALQALGKTLDQLTAADLKPILTYHVVSGTVKSTDLKAGPVQTLSGFSAFVSTTGGAKVNASTVTSADIIATNGVIHVIDKVLLPPNLVEAAGYAGSFGSLIGAVTSAGLAETLAAPNANLRSSPRRTRRLPSSPPCRPVTRSRTCCSTTWSGQVLSTRPDGRQRAHPAHRARTSPSR